MTPGKAFDRVRAKHRSKFDDVMRELSDLIAQIRKYEPRANLYVAGDTINLVVSDGVLDQDDIAVSSKLRWMDCGDW